MVRGSHRNVELFASAENTERIPADQPFILCTALQLHSAEIRMEHRNITTASTVKSSKVENYFSASLFVVKNQWSKTRNMFQ